ncbi:MAG: response regulator [Calditrichaeota bacterium]|nr:response regulator [Calditrichota bacterium]
MKSLIIEDTAVIYRIVNHILSEFGESHIAVNGLEGIKKVKMAIDAGQNYDLICLDIMLPEINGLDVLSNIRNLEKNSSGTKKSKIIILTSLSEPKYIKASLARGCDSYILKPVDKYKLLAEMKKLKVIEEAQAQPG